jgi:hypothetical protein
MNVLQRVCPFVLFAALPLGVGAQGTDDVQKSGESDVLTLILDNTRTKVGRDFYDLFYRHWSAAQVGTDTNQPADASVLLDEVCILTLDEVPTPGPGTASQLVIRVNDEPVWQQVVSGRYDVLDAEAQDAAEVLREYVVFWKIQQQLVRAEPPEPGGR